jgi:hypothetical protein
MDEERCNKRIGEEQFGFHADKVYCGNRVLNNGFLQRCQAAAVSLWVTRRACVSHVCEALRTAKRLQK